MAGEMTPHYRRVGLIMAASGILLLVVAGFVWALQPLAAALNAAVTTMLAILAAAEMGLALWFYRRAGNFKGERL